MPQVLVRDEKYEGSYVAFSTYADRDVVAYASTAIETYRKAQKEGVDSPIVVFIPEGDTTYIY